MPVPAFLQPYFCGHQPFCMDSLSRAALAQAKANIEAYYPLVGVLERLKDTVWLLEQLHDERLFRGFHKFAADALGEGEE